MIEQSITIHLDTLDNRILFFMIAFIEGKIAHLEASYVIVSTGGIGYHIHIPLPTYSQLKEQKECKLYTHFQVKEDSHSLYGFYNTQSKNLFQVLISVSGIGPNTALTLLSSMEYAEAINAIATENVNAIKQVKGIGAKTAERVILELKDKVKKLITDDSTLSDNNNWIAQSSSMLIQDEALAALTTLGINKTTAEKSIQHILKQKPDISIEELIKHVLKSK